MASCWVQNLVGRTKIHYDASHVILLTRERSEIVSPPPASAIRLMVSFSGPADHYVDDILNAGTNNFCLSSWPGDHNL